MIQKVRMADIARKAGVTSATVSMVLNNHPGISAATRERIQRLCEQMGYQRDPVARALASKGSNSAESRYLGTLALLESAGSIQRRSGSPHRKQCDQWLDGACSGAGYRLDRFAVGETEKEQHALSRILQARGIRGLLIFGSNEEVRSWALDWAQFAVVAYTGSLHEHFVHNVMSNSYQDVYDAILKLHERGYKRPGYFMHSHIFDHWAAGFSAALESQGGKKKVPKLILNQSLENKVGRECFFDWFHRYEPDVIVANYDDQLPRILAAEGIRVPEDVGYLCLDVWSSALQLSGLIQLRDEAFQVAVDLLHGMLMRNQFGPPARPICVQIPSVWNEGQSLNPLQNKPV